MAQILAALLCLVLWMIALLHVYWGAGGRWPGHDEVSLTRAVVGTKGLERFPPAWLTLVVAGAILVAGIVPLVWTGLLLIPLPRWLIALPMAGLALVFLLRGIVTYTPVATWIELEEPFATLNRRYYSPLCLVIGGALAGLAICGT